MKEFRSYLEQIENDTERMYLLKKFNKYMNRNSPICNKWNYYAVGVAIGAIGLYLIQGVL